MKMKLEYVGSLNPVVQGVGIIKKGMKFECDPGEGSRLLKMFPKEYLSVESIAKKKTVPKKVDDSKKTFKESLTI